MIDADIQAIIRGAQKCPGQFTELARRTSGQHRQLRAALAIDQAILQIDPDLRIRALEQALDLAKQQFVQGEANIVESIRQTLKHVVQLAAAGGGMRRDQLVITSPDLLVEFDVGSTALAPPMSVLMENSANEKRVIAGVRPKQKRLLWCSPLERNQQIGDVLPAATVALVLLGNEQPTGV